MLQAGACPFQQGCWCGGCEAQSCGGGTSTSMCFQELKMLMAGEYTQAISLASFRLPSGFNAQLSVMARMFA